MRTAQWRPGRDRFPIGPDDDRVATYGRHALDEDALLTPIYHALSRGDWRGRQREQVAAADEMDVFQRDPLTAPIPVQAYEVEEPAVRRPAATPSRARGVPGRHRQLGRYRGGW